LGNIIKTEFFAKQFFKHWDEIQNLAYKMFPERSIEAEQAADYILDKFQENDWERMRKIKKDDQASVISYILVSAGRLCIDFIRKIDGNHRPPKWIQILNGIWTKIYSFLCIQRKSITDVMEYYSCAYPDIKPSEVEHVIDTILSEIVNCGEVSSSYLSDVENIEEEEDCSSNDDYISNLEKAIVKAIYNIIIMEDEKYIEILKDYKNLLESLKIMKDNLVLKPKQRIFLRLIFEEGL